MNVNKYENKYMKYKNKYHNLKKINKMEGGSVYRIWKIKTTFDGYQYYENSINDFVNYAYDIYLSDKQFNKICFMNNSSKNYIDFSNMKVRVNNGFNEDLIIDSEYNI